MLEGELDAHLGYDKHDKSFQIARGFHPKKVKLLLENQNSSSKDRDASFNP
jgi:hypothetical protein